MAREMKDSGIEWIGEIPTDWKLSRLKNIKDKCKYAIVDGPFGTAISTDDYVEEGVPLVRILNLGNPNISNRNLVYITDEHAEKVQRSRFGIGDVVFAKTGATIGKCAINDSIEYGILSSSCVKITISPEYYNKYFYYFFLTKQFNDALRMACVGTTRDTINLTPFACLPCVVPSFDEQHRIADFLDRKCAEIDSVIADTQRTIEEYKKLKQALIYKTVSKGVRNDREMIPTEYEWIGEIPSDWKTIKVKWLLGERKERSETGEEEPLSMSQKFGLIPTKEMDMIPNMAATFVGAKLVYVGDLVFNKLKAHLGVFAVSKYDGLVSPDYAVYYPTGLANVKYLEYLFKTPQYIAEFRKKSSGVGAGLTRLYTGDLFSIYCALPPIEEQEEIIAYLDQKCSEMDALIVRKTALLEELESYKKSVIYEYVTGKKEVPACQ